MDTNTNLIDVTKIKKTFGGVIALNGVDFNLRAGEIHALLGENGAGKSTLIKIICGVLLPDSGSLRIRGEIYKHFNPAKARNLGISTVFQELSLVDELTIEENIYLGHEPITRSGILKRKKRRAKAISLLEYVGSAMDPGIRVRELGAAQQQLVEIAKALSTDPEIIIMDEPTDKLYGEEQEKLFNLLKRMRNEGKGVIYISHKLEELPIIADRVTVLRDGSYVNTFNMQNTTSEELIRNMVGRDLNDLFPKETIADGHEVLRVEGLSSDNFLSNISFSLNSGEILGIGGLVGSGRTSLAKNLSGINRVQKGRIFLNGREIKLTSPAKAILNGIVYLPEDRKLNGLVMSMSVFENIILPSLKTFFIRKKNLKAESMKMVNQLRVKTPNENTKVINLSGGNQQKVVIAKWLLTNAKVYIFDEPTQGIDVGTKTEIYRLMNELTRNGAGIIMISSDMRELIAMSDRIIVMKSGQIAATLGREECTEENILGKAIVKSDS